MPKLDINKVAETIKKHDVEPVKLRAIIEELNLLAQPEADEEREPAVKKQFVILVSDPEGRIKGDFAGWALQIPEDESPATTQDRINRAAYDFNATRKGRLLPVKTVGEAIENVPAKHFKERDVWVKTKTPVLILRTDNAIPFDATAGVPIENMSVEIRTGGKSVKIDADGIRAAADRVAAATPAQ